MDKLCFEFTLLPDTDGKSNIVSITSIITPSEKIYRIPEDLQPADLHREIIKTSIYNKVKNSLKKRYEVRRIWIPMTGDLKYAYLDEYDNLQINEEFLEEVNPIQHAERHQKDTDILEKLFDKLIDNTQENKQQNWKHIAIIRTVLSDFANKKWGEDMTKRLMKVLAEDTVRKNKRVWKFIFDYSRTLAPISMKDTPEDEELFSLSEDVITSWAVEIEKKDEGLKTELDFNLVDQEYTPDEKLEKTILLKEKPGSSNEVGTSCSKPGKMKKTKSVLSEKQDIIINQYPRFPFLEEDPPSHLFCSYMNKESLYGCLISVCVGDEAEYVNKLPDKLRKWEFCDSKYFKPLFDKIRDSFVEEDWDNYCDY